jgi:hypothetical protein
MPIARDTLISGRATPPALAEPVVVCQLGFEHVQTAYRGPALNAGRSCVVGAERVACRQRRRDGCGGML